MEVALRSVEDGGVSTFEAIESAAARLGNIDLKSSLESAMSSIAEKGQQLNEEILGLVSAELQLIAQSEGVSTEFIKIAERAQDSVEAFTSLASATSGLSEEQIRLAALTAESVKMLKNLAASENVNPELVREVADTIERIINLRRQATGESQLATELDAERKKVLELEQAYKKLLAIELARSAGITKVNADTLKLLSSTEISTEALLDFARRTGQVTEAEVQLAEKTAKARTELEQLPKISDLGTDVQTEKIERLGDQVSKLEFNKNLAKESDTLLNKIEELSQSISTLDDAAAFEKLIAKVKEYSKTVESAAEQQKIQATIDTGEEAVQRVRNVTPIKEEQQEVESLTRAYRELIATEVADVLDETGKATLEAGIDAAESNEQFLQLVKTLAGLSDKQLEGLKDFADVQIADLDIETSDELKQIDDLKESLGDLKVPEIEFPEIPDIAAAVNKINDNLQSIEDVEAFKTLIDSLEIYKNSLGEADKETKKLLDFVIENARVNIEFKSEEFEKIDLGIQEQLEEIKALRQAIKEASGEEIVPPDLAELVTQIDEVGNNLKSIGDIEAFEELLTDVAKYRDSLDKTEKQQRALLQGILDTGAQKIDLKFEEIDEIELEATLTVENIDKIREQLDTLSLKEIDFDEITAQVDELGDSLTTVESIDAFRELIADLEKYKAKLEDTDKDQAEFLSALIEEAELKIKISTENIEKIDLGTEDQLDKIALIQNKLADIEAKIPFEIDTNIINQINEIGNKIVSVGEIEAFKKLIEDVKKYEASLDDAEKAQKEVLKSAIIEGEILIKTKTEEIDLPDLNLEQQIDLGVQEQLTKIETLRQSIKDFSQTEIVPPDLTELANQIDRVGNNLRSIKDIEAFDELLEEVADYRNSLDEADKEQRALLSGILEAGAQKIDLKFGEIEELEIRASLTIKNIDSIKEDLDTLSVEEIDFDKVTEQVDNLSNSLNTVESIDAFKELIPDLEKYRAKLESVDKDQAEFLQKLIAKAELRIAVSTEKIEKIDLGAEEQLQRIAEIRSSLSDLKAKIPFEIDENVTKEIQEIGEAITSVGELDAFKKLIEDVKKYASNLDEAEEEQKKLLESAASKAEILIKVKTEELELPTLDLQISSNLQEIEKVKESLKSLEVNDQVPQVTQETLEKVRELGAGLTSLESIAAFDSLIDKLRDYGVSLEGVDEEQKQLVENIVRIGEAASSRASSVAIVKQEREENQKLIDSYRQLLAVELGKFLDTSEQGLLKTALASTKTTNDFLALAAETTNLSDEQIRLAQTAANTRSNLSDFQVIQLDLGLENQIVKIAELQEKLVGIEIGQELPESINDVLNEIKLVSTSLNSIEEIEAFEALLNGLRKYEATLDDVDEKQKELIKSVVSEAEINVKVSKEQLGKIELEPVALNIDDQSEKIKQLRANLTELQINKELAPSLEKIGAEVDQVGQNLNNVKDIEAFQYLLRNLREYRDSLDDTQKEQKELIDAILSRGELNIKISQEKVDLNTEKQVKEAKELTDALDEVEFSRKIIEDSQTLIDRINETKDSVETLSQVDSFDDLTDSLRQYLTQLEQVDPALAEVAKETINAAEQQSKYVRESLRMEEVEKRMDSLNEAYRKLLVTELSRDLSKTNSDSLKLLATTERSTAAYNEFARSTGELSQEQIDLANKATGVQRSIQAISESSLGAEEKAQEVQRLSAQLQQITVEREAISKSQELIQKIFETGDGLRDIKSIRAYNTLISDLEVTTSKLGEAQQAQREFNEEVLNAARQRSQEAFGGVSQQKDFENAASKAAEAEAARKKEDQALKDLVASELKLQVAADETAKIIIEGARKGTESYDAFVLAITSASEKTRGFSDDQINFAEQTARTKQELQQVAAAIERAPAGSEEFAQLTARFEELNNILRRTEQGFEKLGALREIGAEIEASFESIQSVKDLEVLEELIEDAERLSGEFSELGNISEQSFDQIISKAKEAAQAARQNISELSQERGDPTQQFQKLLDLFPNVKKRLRELVDEYGEFTATVGRTKGPLSTQQRQFNTVIDGNHSLRRAIADLNEEYGDFSVAVTRAGTEVEDTSRKTGSLTTAKIALGNIIARLTDRLIDFARDGLRRVKDEILETLEVARRFDQFEALFTGIFDSATVGTEVLKGLRSESERLGFGVEQAFSRILPLVGDFDIAGQVSESLLGLKVLAPDLPFTRIIGSAVEIISGDLRTLSRTFEVAEEPFREAIRRYTDAGFTEAQAGALALGDVLERYGLNLEDIQKTITFQVEVIRERFNTLRLAFGEPVGDAFLEVLQLVNDFLSENREDLILLAGAAGTLVAEVLRSFSALTNIEDIDRRAIENLTDSLKQVTIDLIAIQNNLEKLFILLGEADDKFGGLSIYELPEDEQLKAEINIENIEDISSQLADITFNKQVLKDTQALSDSINAVSNNLKTVEERRAFDSLIGQLIDYSNSLKDVDEEQREVIEGIIDEAQLTLDIQVETEQLDELDEHLEGRKENIERFSDFIANSFFGSGPAQSILGKLGIEAGALGEEFEGIIPTADQASDSISKIISLITNLSTASSPINFFRQLFGDEQTRSKMRAAAQEITDILIGDIDSFVINVKGNFAELGAVIENFGRLVRKEITFDEYQDIIDNAGRVAMEVAASEIEAANIYSQERIEAVTETWEKQEEVLKETVPEVQEYAEALLNLQNASDALIRAQDALAEAQAKVNEEIEKANRKLEFDREKALLDLTRKLLDAETDFNEKRLEKARDYKADLLKIDRDLADERADIIIDLSRDVADIRTDAAREEEDLEIELAQRKIDIEEDLQERLAEIRRKADFDAEEAIRQNDAVALRRIRRRMMFELNEARLARDEQVAEEEKQDRRRREEIQRNLDREIADAQLAAQRKREDAARERAREIRELSISYKNELIELGIAEQNKRDALQLAYDRRLEDLEEANEFRLEELEKSLEDEVEAVEEAEEAKIEAVENSLQALVDAFNAQIAAAAQSADDYFQLHLDAAAEFVGEWNSIINEANIPFGDLELPDIPGNLPPRRNPGFGGDQEDDEDPERPEALATGGSFGANQQLIIGDSEDGRENPELVTFNRPGTVTPISSILDTYLQRSRNMASPVTNNTVTNITYISAEISAVDTTKLSLRQQSQVRKEFTRMLGEALKR